MPAEASDPSPSRRRVCNHAKVPDWLDAALGNAPQGSIVRGGVYWDAYRDPVSVVVLLDEKTGQHLAQWNL
ncbi:exported alanine and valine rich protein [Mycobacterium tuberculosis TB_RSA169]|nr:exported alanine and valine rich protein [Mycobacterium tuberculosis TB_RSA169]